LGVHFEAGVVIVTTEVDIEPLVSLKFLREVFLLRNVLLVSFKILVDALLGTLLVYFQTVDPGVLPVRLSDVLGCAKHRHIKH
jgi:hypothetical protein